MYEDLTGTQFAIFDYIKDYYQKKHFPPSVREIVENTELKSTASVHYQLKRLEEKGYIRRDASLPRALEILKGVEQTPPASISNVSYVETETDNVPVLGTIRAGQPIYAYEEYDESYPLPSSYTRGQKCFMLRVVGNSMINAGILEGDMVIVREQNTARNGDIVVALIEDEATVKTYYLEENRIRLQPENPMLAPIYTRDCTILGKVIGVVRWM
ncbi:MAG: transcriptional repressor LexA [Eubacteriaceae bacterium]|nr:transcriptional repressor LexA [Eubacteriaceae bacterium]